MVANERIQKQKKTWHEWNPHRIVLEDDLQSCCCRISGMLEWFWCIEEKGNTLPAEKGMAVMNSTLESQPVGSRWKPSPVVGSKVEIVQPVWALRVSPLLGFQRANFLTLWDLFRHVSPQRDHCWMISDWQPTACIMQCVTVASCCLCLLAHPKFGQGNLQGFNLMNLSFRARMTLAGLLTSWLHIA